MSVSPPHTRGLGHTPSPRACDPCERGAAAHPPSGGPDTGLRPCFPFSTWTSLPRGLFLSDGKRPLCGVWGGRTGQAVAPSAVGGGSPEMVLYSWPSGQASGGTSAREASSAGRDSLGPAPQRPARPSSDACKASPGSGAQGVSPALGTQLPFAGPGQQASCLPPAGTSRPEWREGGAPSPGAFAADHSEVCCGLRPALGAGARAPGTLPFRPADMVRSSADPAVGGARARPGGPGAP